VVSSGRLIVGELVSDHSAISATVQDILHVAPAASYADIALSAITSTTDTPSGSRDFTLYTNCNCEISATNTAAVQLENEGASTDTLVTEYQLAYDGDGISSTGGATVDFTSYDSFLSSPAQVTYVLDDDGVTVTLYARASNYANQLANAGTYSATQTLTAHWVGP